MTDEMEEVIGPDLLKCVDDRNVIIWDLVWREMEKDGKLDNQDGLFFGFQMSHFDSNYKTARRYHHRKDASHFH